MLKNGSKYLLFLLLVACNTNEKNNNKNIVSYANSYAKLNFNSYKNIYEIINDSIYAYCDNQLKSFLAQYYEFWNVDSLICINSTQDKLVTTINVSHTKSLADGVSGLLGKKINGKWYFFMGGGHLHVPRDMYGKDAMHPLSFYELSQIARENNLSGAVIKNANGELIIDDKWVNSYFEGHGVCAHCKTKAQYDSTHWSKITDKWKHKIDTNEYKPMQRKQHKKANM